jgi:cytoskeletal protein CcmA (bactofilin family)
MSNTINVNGKSYSVSGKNINVVNNKIYVDGNLVEETDEKHVVIEFKGDLASLVCNDAKIQGSVQGDVDANVLHCEQINGDVDANIVNCNSIIAGKVKSNIVNQ